MKRLPVALLALLPFWGCGLPPVCNLSPADPFQEPGETFIVIGDTQQFAMVEWFMGGGPKERARVRERIRRLDPAFVLLAGDLVATGCFESFWKQWLPDGVRPVQVRKAHHLLSCRQTEGGLTIEMHELAVDGSWSIAETVGIGL